MTQRTIKTSSGTVRLGEYVRVWKSLKNTSPGTMFKSSLCGWCSARRETILAEFMDGLQDRINRHLVWYGKGRKWTYEWQLETQRAVRQLNTRRLAIRWLPAWLKTRFAERIQND